jgi:predicted amidohydrolase
MKRFKLALGQMTVVGGDIEGNVQRAVRMISAATDAGAKVVLLPEALDVGWTNPNARTLATAIPDGQTCLTLRAAAQRSSVYVCAGLTERAGDAVFNAAVFISPAGEVVLHHRKLNELEVGHDVYDQGDRLGVVQTPLATFGLMICADGFARGQVVSCTLGLMGADVILAPSAWAVAPGYNNAATPYGALWRENFGAVGRDFRLWVAACSNVGRITGGPWDDHLCIGCSLVVDPERNPTLTGPFGERAETLLISGIKPEPRPARGTGWDARWR